LESRKITALDELKNLLVCDKIKSTPSEACLRHVISVETAQDTWLKKRELTEAIDRYYASHNRQEKPRAFALGQTTPAANIPIQSNAGQNKFVHPSSNGAGRGWTRNGAQRTPAFNGPGLRRCFRCGSDQHLKSACPQLVGSVVRSAQVKRMHVSDMGTESILAKCQQRPEKQQQCVWWRSVCLKARSSSRRWYRCR